MTVEEIYDHTIKQLPAAERLRLAKAILNDIPPRALVDYSEEWSEADLREFSKASWEHVNTTVEKDENA